MDGSCGTYCTYMFPHIYVQHPDVREILLIGFYPQSQEMNRFIQDVQRKYELPIRYEQEEKSHT